MYLFGLTLIIRCQNQTSSFNEFALDAVHISMKRHVLLLNREMSFQLYLFMFYIVKLLVQVRVLPCFIYLTLNHETSYY